MRAGCGLNRTPLGKKYIPSLLDMFAMLGSLLGKTDSCSEMTLRAMMKRTADTCQIRNQEPSNLTHGWVRNIQGQTIA